MLKFRIFATSFLILGLFTAGKLRAEDKVTDLIPVKTLAVGRIRNPEELIDKTAAFVDALQPGLGGQVRQVSQGMGRLIDNQTLAGVDKKQPWWIALRGPEEDRGSSEQPLFIVPLLKGHEEDLPKALGDNYKYVRKGSWGIYTKDKIVFEEVEKLLKGDGKSITSEIDESSGKIFGDGDVAVFLNLTKFIADHRDDLNRSREQIAKEMTRSAERQPAVPGVNTKAAFQAIANIASSLIQGMQDTRSFVIALQISKQGIVLDDLVRVTSDSASDKFLKTVQSAPLTPLSQLPSGHQLYFGFHFELSKILNFVSVIMSAPAAGQEKSMAEFKRIIEELGKLKFGSMAGALKTGSVKEGVLSSVSVAEVDAPEKARTLMHDLYKTLGEISTGQVKQTFTLEADAEKYGNRTADVLTVTTKAEDEAVAKQLEPMMKLLYGPDGAKTRIVYLKDRVIQAMGGGKQALADAIQGQEKTGETDATSPLAKARGALPASANVIVLLDIPTLIKNVMLLAIEQGAPVNIPAATFEGIKLKESYLAGSLGVEPQGLRGRLSLPTEQVQGLVRLALSSGLLQQMGFFN